MLVNRSAGVAVLPNRILDRLRWELREWRTPSRPSFLQEELDHSLLDAVAWSPGERVLDVGCARGAYLRALDERGIVAHGIDIARDLLIQARAAGCPVAGGTGDRLPFAAAAFDAVICHKTMHLFDDPSTVLREFHRVLRDGGRLAFSTSRVRTPYALVQALAIRLTGSRNWDYHNRLGPTAWLRCARQCGFRLETILSCNLVTPLVFRVCDRWIIPNEWMRRYARFMRRLTTAPLANRRAHPLAQDFVIVLRKCGTARTGPRRNAT